MDSLRLIQFLKTSASWPRIEAERRATCDRLSALLETPLVLGWFDAEPAAGPAEMPSSQLSEWERWFARSRDSFEARESADSRQLRVLQLGPDSPARLSSAGDLDHLTLAPMIGTVRKGRQRFGWLGVLSRRSLSAKNELMLVAAAEHLGGLAAVAALDTELTLRDQFLSVASHELKTPLTSIYGVLQLQERMLRPKQGVVNTPEQEKQRSFFKVVIRQVERLNELIDGLLDVSRIQNGRFSVEPCDSDVAQLLHETVASRLGVIAQEAGVRINVEAPTSQLGWVDPVRFEEVVTNLGMNAIRFSPEGGMIWVRLREDQGGFILSLRDQGPAVPENDRSRIFQPFERAQRTTRLGGLGLGLYISRQIAQMHGGTVELVESVAGKGNLFEARFPARLQQQISA